MKQFGQCEVAIIVVEWKWRMWPRAAVYVVVRIPLALLGCPIAKLAQSEVWRPIMGVWRFFGEGMGYHGPLGEG